VLIKSIAQAIPTYVMGAFKLLVGLCEKMAKMIWYFWSREEGLLGCLGKASDA
jgi:hypothetical protein